MLTDWLVTVSALIMQLYVRVQRSVLYILKGFLMLDNLTI